MSIEPERGGPSITYDPVTHNITIENPYGDFYDVIMTWEDAKTLGALLLSLQKNHVKQKRFQVIENGWEIE